MHSKKAHVPKEEYEAIRQCQQEEYERQKQGLKHPWQAPLAPPTVPPRLHHATHTPEYSTQNIPQGESGEVIHHFEYFSNVYLAANNTFYQVY